MPFFLRIQPISSKAQRYFQFCHGRSAATKVISLKMRDSLSPVARYYLLWGLQREPWDRKQLHGESEGIRARHISVSFSPSPFRSRGQDSVSVMSRQQSSRLIPYGVNYFKDSTMSRQLPEVGMYVARMAHRDKKETGSGKQ